MAQEEKEQLLNDLCARLPYGVKINIDSDFLRERGLDIQKLVGVDFSLMLVLTEHDCYHVEKIKSYLRPLSSMRVGEILCLYKFFSGETCCLPEYTEEWGDFRTAIQNNELYIPSTCDGNKVKDGFDWLDSKHIDYRGLIERGLALEAPEGMYGENC